MSNYRSASPASPSRFANIRISTRLGVGFAIILLLSIVSTSFALINARSAAEATRRMMDEPLAKERLAADLRPLISAAVWRTALIAGSSDQSLSVTFAAPIAEGTRQGTALMKQIGDRVSTPDEKAAFASITEHRKNYQAAKVLIMEAKKTGDAAEGARVYKDVFEPEANRYQASVSDLVKLQRKAIDDSALASPATTRAACAWRSPCAR